jgi:RimJ/RimL family protein N-acetyltransferase
MPPTASDPLSRPRRIHLRDGLPYHVRTLRPGDEALVQEMFDTLAPSTVHARYGYLIHHMTPAHARRLATPDPAREVALGIFEIMADGREKLWAMGRLVHAPDDRSAECAFLVHDAKRRLGMASRLLFILRILARWRGVQRLFAQVRRDNRAMLGVFRRHHAALHFDPGGEVVDVDVPLRTPKILFDKPSSA